MDQQTQNMTSTAQDDIQNDEIDILEIFQVLLKRIWTLGWMTIAFIIVGIIIWLSQPKVYQSDTLIQVESQSGSPLGLDITSALLAEPASSVAEIEIIKSRRVLGRVVDNLGLTVSAEPTPLPVLRTLPQRFAITDPQWGFLTPYDLGDASIKLELDASDLEWGQESIQIIKGQGDAFEIIFPNGVQDTGALGETVYYAPSDFKLTLTELNGAPGRSFRILRVSRLRAIERLRQNLSVSEAGRGSSILRATYKDTDAQRGASILRNIAQVYFDQNIARSSAEVQQSLEFIEAQIPQARAAFDAAQARLNDYRSAQESVNLELETEAILNQAINIRGQLNALDLEEQNIAQRFNQNHPTYRRLLATRAELLRQLEAVERQTQSLPETQRRVLNLRQGLEVSQEIYFQLEANARELRVARAATIGNVRILDDAVTQERHVAPRGSFIVGLCALAGFSLAVGFVLLSHFLKQRLKDLGQISRMGFNLFGVIPRVNALYGGNLLRRKDFQLVKNLNDTDVVIEALRSLRTAVSFGLMDSDNQTVSITSAAPEDGKSFVSINFADICSTTGSRVCLVDTDMRRGYLARYFGLSRRTKGLSEFLAGKAALDEVKYTREDAQFTLIPCGDYPPNPAELLLSYKFKSLLSELKAEYDLIIFDTAPVLAVTDPMIVMRQVGVALAVVRHLKTEVHAIEGMRNIVHRNNLKLDGVIVNSFDPRSVSGYQSESYTGQYRYKAAK